MQMLDNKPFGCINSAEQVKTNKIKLFEKWCLRNWFAVIFIAGIIVLIDGIIVGVL